ncbi:hypothetical protein PR048_021904 [Dryococelus australis]|uniref:Uncharacterized protein n=1 Tax=Dryococelus australis TaxID=614101 RepID=A0ABQ9GZI5_9NEOP|nr:hypothetical protein PR048_021904 [Dryococelus australis]
MVCVCVLQYDSGYGRSRLGSGSGSGMSSTPTGRSGGGTTSAYKSTYSAPSTSTTSYTRDRSSTRDGPVKYAGSSSSSFKEGDRLSLRDKYTTGTYPGRSRESSLSSYDRKDSDYGSRGLVRRKSSTSRDPSPEVSSNYVSTLSPYRLYGRNSYSRSNSRDAGGDSATSTSSTPATTPVHVPSSLRFTTGARYSGSSSVRSPVSEKSPTVYSRSFSRSSSQQDHEGASRRKGVKSDCVGASKEHKKSDSSTVGKTSRNEDGEVTQTTFVTVVTRGTSPTPPSTSSFLRSRRADMTRSVEKTIARPTVKPEMVDKEMQSDRGDDTSRTSRFSSRLSSSPWSSYLDRYSSTYSPVSRYSSRYGNYSSPSSAKSNDRDTPSATHQTNDSSESANSTSVTNAAAKENISSSPRINSESLAKEVISQKVSEAMKGNDVKQSLTPSPDVENLKQSLKVIAEKTALGSNDMTNSNTSINSGPSSTADGKIKESVGNHIAVNKAKSSTNLLKKSSSDCNSQVKPNTSVPKTYSNNSIAAASPLTPSPSNNLAKQCSPDSSSRKLLPPTVPKAEAQLESQVLKPSSSLHALNKLGIPNKDFRKSALNVELTNILQAEAFKKMQEQQRKTGKNEKNKRSGSISSGDSEYSPATSGSVPLLSTANSTCKLRESKSLSKLHSNKKTNQLTSNLLPTGKGEKSKSPSFRKTSDAQSSSSSESTSSDETSSESSSSSSSETSSSDEKTENNVIVRRRRRTSRSSTTPEKKGTGNTAVSTKPIISAPADETCGATEKPPRPPSSPRAQVKTEEAKSFLMRALAPVTNLFRGKSQESLGNNSTENLTESVEKMGSTQSLNKSFGSDQEDAHGKKNNLSGSPKVGISKIKSSKSKSKLLESHNDNSEAEKRSKPKFKLRKQESGERAWWLQSNSNIPEGIQRIASNISLNKISDSENKTTGEPDTKTVKNFKLRKQESGEIPWWLDANGEMPEGIQRIKSSHSMAKLNEQNSRPDSSNKEEEIKKYKLRRQQSGEKAWWLKSNCDVPAGIMKLQSNKSLSDFLQNELKAKVQKVGKDKSSAEERSEESASDEGQKEVVEGNSAKSSHVPKFPLTLPANSVSDSSSAVHEGEDTGRRSPYDNLQEQKHPGARPAKSKAASKARPKNLPLFIGNHTNIDDILGSAATLVNPLIGLSKLRRGKGGKKLQLINLLFIPMSVIKASVEQLRNERAGETGDSRENPPTNGIVRHDSRMRNSGSDPAGDVYSEENTCRLRLTFSARLVSCPQRTWRTTTMTKMTTWRRFGVGLNNEVLRADGVRMEQRRNARAGKTRDPEKIRRPTASFGTIPTCEIPGVTGLGIEPGSPWWEANSVTTQPP